MERNSTSHNGASDWIEQAIHDVDHLRQEIAAPATGDQQLEADTEPSPELRERLEAARVTLGELTRALACHMVPMPPSPWIPPVEVCDMGQEIEASFDLPGVPRSSIRIRAANSTLFVSGERPAESARSDAIHFSERRHGPFGRAVELPCQVDAKASSAMYRDGCLTVRLPKQTENVATDS